MKTAEPAVWRIEILPAERAFPVREGDTILSAAEQAGIKLPSSCRNGSCRACLCRLLSGRIKYRVDWPSLSAEEKQAGWILPCVAEPLTSACIEQADVRDIVAPDHSEAMNALRANRGF